MRRVALLSFVSLLSCEPLYEAPCRVERQTEVAADPMIGIRGNVSLARSDGGFVASWVKLESPDGGTDPTPSLVSFEVVDLDATGALLRRETVSAPPELRARKGSIEVAGIARENGATLIHWVESVTSTDPDGRVRTAFSLQGAYGDRVVAPPAFACERCTLRVAVVAFAEETVAFVRTTADVVLDVELGKPPPPPAFTAVRFRRDGSVERTPLPFLSVPQELPVAGARIVPPAQLHAERDLDGRIVVTTDGRAWRVDRALRVVAGPVALPAMDARALWPLDDAAPPSVLWSVSPNEDGRSTAQFTKREVFLTNGASRERISLGRVVLAGERRDDEVGVLFESSGRGFFALTSANGRKRGGDVFVRTVDGNGSQYGEYEPQDATVLASPSAGRFTVVELGRGKLTATEIVCAP